MIDARIRLPAQALCVFVSLALASTAGAGQVRVTIWEGLRLVGAAPRVGALGRLFETGHPDDVGVGGGERRWA